MSGETKVCVAFMAPIRAKDIRWERLFVGGILPTTLVGDARTTEADHPITRALRERLPVMVDDQLIELRAMLVVRKTSRLAGATSKATDVDAWLAMVDNESRRRATMRGGVLVDLIKMLNGETP